MKNIPGYVICGTENSRKSISRVQDAGGGRHNLHASQFSYSTFNNELSVVS